MTVQRYSFVRIAIALTLLSAAVPAAFAQPVTSGAPTPLLTPATAKADRPLIQVAILLDTSNSMDGLINQARASLWRIVSELARAKRQGQTPELQVALYEYGNDSISSRQGHIRQVSALTTDLDLISESLFGLTTNGGQEYCGQTIAQATKELEWSARKDALKMIFIAGNEPFSQGSVDYRKAAREAIAKGIVINTIHCGSEDEGIRGGWREGAQLADGRYSFIDSNRAVAQVQAPQDAELERLGDELNRTYMAYGRKGQAKKARMEQQDSNAGSLGSSSKANRVAAKASAQYRNDDWDLVDAMASGAAAPAALADEELPEELKGKSAEERTRHVQELQKKRAEVQQKIDKLSKERAAFVAQKQKESATTEYNFDDAVLESIEGQATKQGWELAK